MSIDDLNPALQNVFENARQDIADEAFTTQVMAQADTLKRRKMIRRLCVGLLFALVAVPMQDIALATTHILVLSLVEIDDSLLAQVLAPVNSVGSLLSFVLLCLRLFYKRIFA
jgi:hypothetical protein